MESNLKVLHEETNAKVDTIKTDSTSLENGIKKKESPYDHLPCEVNAVGSSEGTGGDESAERSGVNSSSSPAGGNSPPASPRSIGNGRASPDDGAEDFSTLDYIPRSSPTVQARSITPEHAQHLRKLSMKDGGNRVSATVRGKRSPPNKMAKRSNTMAAFSTNSAHGTVTPPEAEMSERIAEDEGLYNVPRPSSATDLYKIPKSILDSPPTRRSNGVSDSTYATPKPSEQSRVNDDDESLYKTPSSISASERLPGTGNETYDTPRTGSETYDTPRTGSDVMRTGSETYDTPRPMRTTGNGSRYALTTTPGSNGVSETYSTPRPAHSHSPHTSPSRRNNYESIDTDAPSTTSAMRPARSFESLHRFRLATPEPYIHTTPISPPAAGPKRPVCEYVDIELEEGRPSLPPAKNAPLPPLPTVTGPPPIADSVYAEITEEAIASNRIRHQSIAKGASPAQSSSRPQPNTNPQSLYNELPPTRPWYPDTSASAREGMAKAQELAEEEGYELFLPATLEKLRKPVSSQAISGQKSPALSDANALLEKYNINIHDSSVRGRPYSESDVLEDSRSSSSKLGTSIPLDGADSLSDEYIIVTGPDRRPKSGDGVFPHRTNASTAGEDQYEAMNSQYSTPNPSLGGSSSVPQPQSHSHSSVPPAHSHSNNNNTNNTTTATAFTRQPTPKQMPARQKSNTSSGSASGSPPVTRRQDSETPSAGINLSDMMSPTDSSDAKPFFTNAVSSGSRSPSSERSEEGEGQAPPPSSSSSSGQRPSLVRIMAGSPMDRSNSIELK